MELQAVDDACNTIDLMRLPKAPYGDGYMVRFCPRDGEGFWPGKKRYDDPSQILYLMKIPHENVLDPYMVAKLNGEDPKDFIKRFPITPNLKAEQFIPARLRSQDDRSGAQLETPELYDTLEEKAPVAHHKSVLKR